MKCVKQCLALVLLLALVLSVGVCASADEQLDKYSGFVFDAFDTTTTVTAYTAGQEEFDTLLTYIQDELMRYHQLFDIYNPYDGLVNLYEVNRHAAEGPMEVPQEIMDILSFGKEMYGKTNGNMNIAFGSVLSIWHEVREYDNAADILETDKILPDEAELLAAAEHCDINDLILDEEAGTVYFADPELKLDVGAVAKGYAVECVAQSLIAQGYDHVLINAGGNVRAIGNKPTGANWVIGVQNPDLSSSNPYVAKVSVCDQAVITSGVYQRYFEYNGKRYHHIIDKDTLQPEDRYLSVSILLDSSALGDALSTAVFNMPYEEGSAFVEGLDGVEAMWVLNDGTILYSSGFEANTIQ